MGAQVIFIPAPNTDLQAELQNKKKISILPQHKPGAEPTHMLLNI